MNYVTLCLSPSSAGTDHSRREEVSATAESGRLLESGHLEKCPDCEPRLSASSHRADCDVSGGGGAEVPHQRPAAPPREAGGTLPDLHHLQHPAHEPQSPRTSLAAPEKLSPAVQLVWFSLQIRVTVENWMALVQLQAVIREEKVVHTLSPPPVYSQISSLFL